MIDRRETLQRLSLLVGGTLSTQLTAGLMGQVLNDGPSLEVTDAQRALIAELADVIIPDTQTPGAKAAGVQDFIIRVIRDCHPITEQEAFYGGLAKLDQASREAHQKPFIDLDGEAKKAMVNDLIKTSRPFFQQFKKMTVTGYFTSEIGATQTLAYLPIPGKFQGDIPLEEGQKTWAIR